MLACVRRGGCVTAVWYHWQILRTMAFRTQVARPHRLLLNFSFVLECVALLSCRAVLRRSTVRRLTPPPSCSHQRLERYCSSRACTVKRRLLFTCAVPDDGTRSPRLCCTSLGDGTSRDAGRAAASRDAVVGALRCDVSAANCLPELPQRCGAHSLWRRGCRTADLEAACHLMLSTVGGTLKMAGPVDNAQSVIRVHASAAPTPSTNGASAPTKRSNSASRAAGEGGVSTSNAGAGGGSGSGAGIHSGHGGAGSGGRGDETQ